MPDPKRRHLAASKAAKSRWHPDADTTLLDRDLRAAHLEEHVREAVAGWPPLTDEQKSGIAVLLRSSQPLDTA
jgi:hypothetical protein